ncbi:HAMP domain-containing protein [Saliterribacillus persicus]|uniref:HAMP domain-containing protein n=1 Tax=Saliterribacillus persicus TaxID=930114 RepID=A0A368Y3G7_9BACI|nr:HAMP domain-containing protein [Saliterribacillus persicus]RCW74823.1 HAMP domain-containing protein [Saliterribacillus persicus]
MNALTKFGELSIRSKFIIAFCVLFLWLGSAQITQFVLFISYIKQYNEMTETITLTNSIHGELREELDIEIRDIVYGKVHFDEGVQYQLLDQMRLHLNVISSKDTENRFLSEISEVEKTLDSAEEYINKLGEQIKFDAPAEEKYITQEYISIASQLINENVQTLLQKTLQESEKNELAIKNQMNNDVRISIFIFVIVIFTSFIFVWIISNNIARPIRLLRDYSNEIANGNLTIQMKTIQSENEVGDLYKTFKLMTNHLKQMIDSVLETSNHIVNASKDLHESMDDNRKAGEDIAYTQQEIYFFFRNQEEINNKILNLEREILDLTLLQQEELLKNSTKNKANYNNMIEVNNKLIEIVQQLLSLSTTTQKQSKDNQIHMEKLSILGEEQLTTIEEIAEASEKQLANAQTLQKYIKKFRI